MSNAGAIANLKSGIASKQAQIDKLETAKVKLTNLYSLVDATINSWNRTKSANLKGGITSEVLVKNIFEGNMAKTLKPEYKGLVKSIVNGANDASEAKGKISSQKRKIDDKITELKSSISSANSSISSLKREDEKNEQDKAKSQ